MNESLILQNESCQTLSFVNLKFYIIIIGGWVIFILDRAPTVSSERTVIMCGQAKS